MSSAVQPIARSEVYDATLDKIEARILEIGGDTVSEKGGTLPEMPVRHTFTPGIYSREITMPAGSILTSKIHKTEHQFVVSRGRCSVFDGAGFVTIEAPYHGVTKPGTRRLLVVHEETVWTTFHATTATDLSELEDELIEVRENPLLEDGGDA